jgi:hypothetical protein
MNNQNPKWWNDETTSKWDRTKDAMKRDWEQTKHDVTGGGRDLDQDVDDTVKQAVGRDAIPPMGTPNPEPWDRVEPGVRYGYGAAGHYADQKDWNDGIEAKLREEWNDLKTGRTWDEIKSAVRRGWDKARGKVKKAA